MTNQCDKEKSSQNDIQYSKKKYKFCVMFLNLINVLIIFQNIMNDILSFDFDKFVIVYFDDILIYNKNNEKHLKQMQLVIKTFHKNNHYAKSSNCVFFSKIYKVLRLYYWRRKNAHEREKIQIY